MNREVRNHILGYTTYFLLMLSLLFITINIFNLQPDSYAALIFIAAIIAGFLGDRLLKKFFPHFIREFKETNFELFLFVVIVSALKLLITKDISIWMSVFLYYIIFIVIFGFFEQRNY